MLEQLTGAVRALFSDLDGTLTTDGCLQSLTYSALERLDAAGIPVIIVTGRPAGWGQALASLSAATAVVTENGGVSFLQDGRRWRKVYGIPEDSLAEWRRRMSESVARAMKKHGGSLSSDSQFREVDLAVDWNEENALSAETAEAIASDLRADGFTATRSSVHVNFGPPKFDKFSACKVMVNELFAGAQLDEFVYVGDALNDAPMFGGFPRSVGVANVRDLWDELEHKPAFVCSEREGAGFRELTDRVLTLGPGASG